MTWMDRSQRIVSSSGGNSIGRDLDPQTSSIIDKP